MTQVKGEARTLQYTPGEAVPESLPAEDGDYNITLKNKGKEGLKGWRQKPKKFPNRRVVFTIGGTEDEVTGEEKEVVEYISLSPKILRRVAQLAQAAGYPEAVALTVPQSPNDPSLRETCGLVDAILDYIESNGVVLRARLGSDEFNGQMTNRISKWLPPEGEGGTEASEDEEQGGLLADAGGEETEEAEEDEAPARPAPAPKKNGHAKPVHKNGKKK